MLSKHRNVEALSMLNTDLFLAAFIQQHPPAQWKIRNYDNLTIHKLTSNSLTETHAALMLRFNSDESFFSFDKCITVEQTTVALLS